MSKNHESRYKTSRTTAGMTQEAAAELLGVAPRTLSDYENDRARVPDDIVASMADVYKSPLLAWWHLKNHSVLGKYLPDVSEPQTHGDMAFQLILAQDDLAPSVTAIKRIVAGGEICEIKKKDFDEAVEGLRGVKSKLLSAIVYAGKILDG
jgi:transcriptional regulator with XRE-family HTH domain